ncbi:MAG: FKBP-type peptidyl-prolyl cis-trans isomerase [Bacteroidales bacterium]|nr:FKBP-type peptidyl-prolyl cis-trans isomerase [Bacteroidales bacterium]
MTRHSFELSGKLMNNRGGWKKSYSQKSLKYETYLSADRFKVPCFIFLAYGLWLQTPHSILIFKEKSYYYRTRNILPYLRDAFIKQLTSDQMKNFRNAGLIVLAIITLHSCNTVSHKSMKLESNTDSVAYMIGVSVGHSMKMQKMDNMNPDLIAKGIDEVLSGDSVPSSQQANMYVSQYIAKLREEASQINLEKGQAFLAENKEKEGVIETESGLQYKVIEEGTGKTPTVEDAVKCHYRGTTIDGKQFDSSYDKGQPAEFRLKGVIRGWTEVLQLMKEGAKYEVYIPSYLGYGTNGTRSIEPNSTLIFEIELLEVIPKE